MYTLSNALFPFTKAVDNKNKKQKQTNKQTNKNRKKKEK